jgi:hypothetical protein
VFNAAQYLDSHLRRRHPEQANYIEHEESPSNSAHPVEETDLAVDSSRVQQQDQIIDRLTKTIEEFSNRLQSTEDQLKQEMEARLALELQEQQAHLQHLQDMERERHKQEMELMQSQMHSELEQERLLLLKERQKLEELALQVQNSQKTLPRAASNLGNLEDDGESELEEIHPQIAPPVASPVVDINKIMEQLAAQQNQALSSLQQSVANEMTAFKELLHKESNKPVSGQVPSTSQQLEVLQQALGDTKPVEKEPESFTESDFDEVVSSPEPVRKKKAPGLEIKIAPKPPIVVEREPDGKYQ